MEKGFWRKRLSCLLPSPSSCAFPLFFPQFVHFAGIIFSRIISNLSPCHLLTRADVGSWRRHRKDRGTSPFAGSRSLDQLNPIFKSLIPRSSPSMLRSIPTSVWDIFIYGSVSMQGILHTPSEGHISAGRFLPYNFLHGHGCCANGPEALCGPAHVLTSVPAGSSVFLMLRWPCTMAQLCLFLACTELDKSF